MTPNSLPLPACPYKGLDPYEEKDRAYFFGRERDQKTIISNLFAMPLTILYGASGVGKSSVLMAGVVPYLKESSRLPVVVFRNWQGDTFTESLKSAVLKAIEDKADKESLKNIDLKQSFDSFLAACNEAAGSPIFFIFDQFEEYFLYHSASTAEESFDAAFARAVNRKDIDAKFLLSMRGEELSKLDRFRGRIPNILGNMLRLSHLDRASAERAIREPLTEYNSHVPDHQKVKIEDDLIGALLDKATPDADGFYQMGAGGDSTQVTAFDVGIETPVLQILLDRLWKEEMKAGSRTLRLETFKEKLGGAESIISTYLNEVMQRLSESERSTAASVFRFLVTPSRTKIAQDSNALAAWAEIDEAQVQAVLTRLSYMPDTRVLRTVRVPGGQTPRYEIFHDVLARAILDWRAQYVQAQEKARAAQRAAEEAAAREKEAARNQQLEQAEALAEAQRQRVEYQKKTSRRLRRLVVALAVMFLLALGSTVVAAVQLLRARSNERTAEQALGVARLEKLRADSEKDQADKQRLIAEDRATEIKKAADDLKESIIETKAAKDEAEKQAQHAKTSERKALESREQAVLALSSEKREKERAITLAGEVARLKDLEAERNRIEARRRRAEDLSQDAFVFYSNNNFSEAVAKYKETLPIYQEMKDKSAEANTYVSIGGVYYRWANSNKLTCDTVEQEFDDTYAPENKEAGKGEEDSKQHYDEAAKYYKLAIGVRESIAEDNELAEVINYLAVLYAMQDKFSDAKPLYERALKIREKILAPGSPELALGYSNLGSLYQQQGIYQEAEQFFNKALDISSKRYSLSEDESGEEVASIHNQLGLIYISQAQYSRAESQFQQSLVINEKVKGPDNLDVASNLHNLSLIYLAQAQYEKVEPLQVRAIAISKKAPNVDHNGLYYSHSVLGRLYEELARYDEADRHYQIALAELAKVKTQKERKQALLMHYQAQLYVAQGKYEQARQLEEKAVSIFQALIPDHWLTSRSRNTLAKIYASQGRKDEALSLHQQAFEALEKTFDSDHPEIANSLIGLAKLYIEMGKYDLAEPHLKRAQAINEKMLGIDHPSVAETLEIYSVLLRKTTRQAEASLIEARAKAIRAKYPPKK